MPCPYEGNRAGLKPGPYISEAPCGFFRSDFFGRTKVKGTGLKTRRYKERRRRRGSADGLHGGYHFGDVDADDGAGAGLAVDLEIEVGAVQHF
jgi:hypothetical protein